MSEGNENRWTEGYYASVALHSDIRVRSMTPETKETKTDAALASCPFIRRRLRLGRLSLELVTK
jgi:hypothetical protein